MEAAEFAAACTCSNEAADEAVTAGINFEFELRI